MPTSPGPRSHKTPTPLRRFLFGAPYYPEHWMEEDMKDDADLMQQAGFNVVRMAEFAWDKMEPTPGAFDFSFFDGHIERMAKAGIGSFLCTPTATPPAWLTQKYPGMLRVARDGRRMTHGSRQHACHSSAIFREHGREITQAMAKHFAANPNVIGWQTDNEFFCHFSECHCSNCTTAFREFLRRKYGSIDELNKRWGAAFWAQTYNDFEQVEIPVADLPTHQNPSAYLDYHTFLSDEVTSFQGEQIAILREANPKWWITHNGIMSNIDYRKFSRDLDFLGVDVYPMFSKSPDRAAWAATLLDITRSFGGNFIVPELQSGPGGQGTYFHDNVAPGQMRLFAWQGVARGADGILHFRWRTCRFGAEQYWCGILDHDNIPRRRYQEAIREGGEFARLGPELLGTYLSPQIGVLYDSGPADMGHMPITCGLPWPRECARQAWRAWWKGHYHVGMVHPEDDLTGFRLVLVPSWAIITPEVAVALEKFVEAGGTLVITARSGIKNADSHVISETPPGLLAHVSGCQVIEASRVNEPEVFPNSFLLGETEVNQHLFLEILEPTTGEILARWKNRYQAGQPAVVKNRFGKGTCVYIGTFLDETNTRQLIPFLAEISGTKPLLPGLPDGVEVTIRENGSSKLWFLLNHNEEEKVVEQVPAGTELISGRASSGTLTLEPFGVAVIRE